MFIAGFPAAALGTNCYVASAEGPGGECVVIDPGVGVMGRLRDLLAEHRLRPVGVLLTHGHFDHVFSVSEVCGTFGIPAFVHPNDRGLLTDPTMGLGFSLEQLVGKGNAYTEPDDLTSIADGDTLSLAGLDFVVDHVPGHTAGSVFFRTEHPHGEPVCFTGDVLFAGTIGRTDLPGGDSATMMTSLRTKVLPLADETVVLSGHGEQTTIGRERATNPFLTGLGDVDARRTGN